MFKRFVSNWYYFWGHTCWHITTFKFFDPLNDIDDFTTPKARIYTFIYDKYQYYIGLKYKDTELYWWQKKYYG